MEHSTDQFFFGDFWDFELLWMLFSILILPPNLFRAFQCNNFKILSDYTRQGQNHNHSHFLSNILKNVPPYYVSLIPEYTWTSVDWLRQKSLFSLSINQRPPVQSHSVSILYLIWLIPDSQIFVVDFWFETMRIKWL